MSFSNLFLAYIDHYSTIIHFDFDSSLVSYLIFRFPFNTIVVVVIAIV